MGDRIRASESVTAPGRTTARRRRTRAPGIAAATLVLALVGLLLPSVVAARIGPTVREYRSAPCPVELSTRRHVDCGYLLVPQARDRRLPGIVLRVAVAIVRARDPLPDPVLFLMGGPDCPGIAPFSIDYLEGEYGRRRDLILVDVRGVGASRPYLGCPELDEADADAFPEWPTLRAQERAHRACRARLEASGVDRREYGAADVARDLADLRVTLGIRRWNVMALSAGGEAALELMRLDASGIRAAVLDSIITRAWVPWADWWTVGKRLLDKLFRDCTAQAECAAAYPDLERRFYAEVDRLDREPFTSDVRVQGGGTVQWVIDGDFLLDEGMWVSRHPIDAATAPAHLDRLVRGGLREFVGSIVLEPPFPVNSVLALGRAHASRCRDDIAFLTRADLTAEIAREPRLRRFLADDYRHWAGYCRAWDAGRSDPAGRGYLDTDLPVLLIRGEWDGAIDTRYMVEQARRMPRGTLVTFPARGHVLLFDGPTGDVSCERSITSRFLADPSRRPDTSCVADMPDLRFTVGEPATRIVPGGRERSGLPFGR
jgi:pimeloyl-ACP methyl ester carboxylesterase